MKIKKSISIAVSAVMAVTAWGAAMASVNAVGSADFNYLKVDDDGNGTFDHVEITGCRDNSAVSLEIPSEIDGLEVSSIADNAFEGLGGLTDVVFPDLSIDIGENAFSGCTALENITFPTKECRFGANAFDSTTWLDNMIENDPLVIVNDTVIDGKNCVSNLDEPLDIPDTVKAIAAGAFLGNENIEMLSIPASVGYFGKNAFEETPWLETIRTVDELVVINGILIDGKTVSGAAEIPDDALAIADGAFMDNAELTSVIIHEKINTLPDEVFSNCESLTSVTINSGLGIIGEKAFENCVSLRKINIPESVRMIKKEAFAGCSELTSATLPSALEYLGEKAFYDCSALESVIANIGLTKINDMTFMNCTSLEAVTIPPTVKRFGKDVFAETPWLETMREINPLVRLNKVIIDGRNAVGDVELEDVTAIAPAAFKDNSEVTSIVIPQTVGSIGEEAFSGCSSITYLNVPMKVSEIPERLCSDCIALEKVEIADGAKSIGAGAFEGCKALESISIPVTVTDIDENAFTEFYGYIFGEKDSAAEKFAEENNFSFAEFGTDPFAPVETTVITTETTPEITTTVTTTAKTTKTTKATTTAKTTKATTTTETTEATTTAKTTKATTEKTTKATTTKATTTPEVTTTVPEEIVPGPQPLKGDANLDGKVNVRDAAYIAKCLAQGVGDTLPENADANGDGKVNVRDAAAIAKALATGQKIK